MERDIYGRFARKQEIITGTEEAYIKESNYTANEMYTDKRKEVKLEKRKTGIKASDIVATPNGKFNWLGVLIEIGKVAITALATWLSGLG